MAGDKTYTTRVEITDSEGVIYSVPLTDLSEEIRNELISSAKDSLDGILQDSIGANIDDDFMKEPAKAIESHVSSYSHSPGMPYGLNNLDSIANSELRETLTDYSKESKAFSDLELAYLLEFTNSRSDDEKTDGLLKINRLVPVVRRKKIYDSLREKNYEISGSDRARLSRKFDGTLVQIIPSEDDVRGRGHLVTLTAEGKDFVCDIRDGMRAFRDQMDGRLYLLDDLLKSENNRPSGYVSRDRRTSELINNSQFPKETVDELLEDLKTNGYIQKNGLSLNNKGKVFLETFRERLDYLNQSEAIVEEVVEPETNMLVDRLRDKTHSEEDIKELEKLLKVDGISEEVTTAVKFITAYDGLSEREREFMNRPEMISVYEGHITSIDEHYRSDEEPVVENNLSKEEVKEIIKELIDVDELSEMDTNQRGEYYKQIYSDARLTGVSKRSIGGHIAWIVNPDSFKKD